MRLIGSAQETAGELVAVAVGYPHHAIQLSHQHHPRRLRRFGVRFAQNHSPLTAAYGFHREGAFRSTAIRYLADRGSKSEAAQVIGRVPGRVWRVQEVATSAESCRLLNPLSRWVKPTMADRTAITLRSPKRRPGACSPREVCSQEPLQPAGGMTRC